MVSQKVKKSGSYTVEAAFIVPLVLGLAFVILYTLFLLHDRAVLQSNLEYAVFSTVEGNSLKEEEYAEYLSQGLWIMEVKKAQCMDGKFTVSGEASASAEVTVPILSLFMDGTQEISVSGKYSKLQPEIILRYGADFVKKDKKN